MYCLASLSIAATCLSCCGSPNRTQPEKTAAPAESAVIASDEGSKKEEAPTQDAADSEEAPKKETLPTPETPILQDTAANDPIEQAPSPADAQFVLSPEDAQKWDVVPDIGYWCTDPKGCPVNGNIAQVDTRLAHALPLPQGQGYLFTDGSEKWKVNWNWRCHRPEGCACGKVTIKNDATCYDGDTYTPGDALNKSACNAQTCHAFCRDNQCACGDHILKEDIPENYRCDRDNGICEKENGCQSYDIKYSHHQNKNAYHLLCNELGDCPCGSITCAYDELCVFGENKCIDEKGAVRTADTPRPQASEKGDEDTESCASETGCPCGSQLCPTGYKCIENRCVYEEGAGDGSPGHFAFYCDKDNCLCGSQICPKGAACDHWDGDSDWTNQFGYRCVHVGLFENEKAIFDFLNLKDFEVHLAYQLENAETDDYIFDETYYGDLKDVTLHQNYYLSKKDGKEVNLFVVCSQPGCDCNGIPLRAGYLCVEQHVVFANTDTEDDYGLCPFPYRGFTHDRPSVGGPCDIADDVHEQLCVDPNGCLCDLNTIPMGDICVNHKARCSTLNPRPGCSCGMDKPGDGYGCYQGQWICQQSSCSCRETTIPLGHICAEQNVICGADSTMTGCLCGDKPLRDGYRCVQKEQLGKDDKPTISPEKNPHNTKCGNHYISSDTELYVIDHDRQYEVDHDEPELEWLACTCGTGKEAPGDGYGCALVEDSKGNGSEWTSITLYAGWQCQKYEGCACGNMTCQPGDLCEESDDGSKSCSPFNTFDGYCDDHYLPPKFIHDNGYKCYAPNEAAYAKGWYCAKADGCPCGEITCEAGRMCLSPGVCSKNIMDSEREYKTLQQQCIRYSENECVPEPTPHSLNSWKPNTPNPLLSSVPNHATFIAASQRDPNTAAKSTKTILKAFVDMVETGIGIASDMPHSGSFNLSDWGIDPSGKADVVFYAHDNYVVISITVNDDKKAVAHMNDWFDTMLKTLNNTSKQADPEGKYCYRDDHDQCEYWAMGAFAGNEKWHLRDIFNKELSVTSAYHVENGVVTLVLYDYQGVLKDNYRIEDALSKDILIPPRNPYLPQDTDNQKGMTFRIHPNDPEKAVFTFLNRRPMGIDANYLKKHFLGE